MRSSGFVTASTLEAQLLRTEAGVKTRSFRSRKMFSDFNYNNSKDTCMFIRKKMKQKSRQKYLRRVKDVKISSTQSLYQSLRMKKVDEANREI